MLFRLFAAGLIVFGGWQIGQGAYLLAKAELAQWLLEQASGYQIAQTAYQKKQPAPQKVSPWPWADTWPVAKLHWPQYHQELIIVEGGSGRNLAFAPAHLSATVMPGEQGVSVIGGHRDTQFNFLQFVAVGDIFSIETVNGEIHQFQVTDIVIADVRESKIALDASQAKIALVACYPFNDWQAGGPLRYLVSADSIGTEKIKKDEWVPSKSNNLLTKMIF